MKKERLPDELVRECPEELPKGLTGYVVREIVERDHVLVYKKGNVRGTCYQCGEEVRAEPGQRFRNTEWTRCPSCGGEVQCVIEGGAFYKASYLDNVCTLQRGRDKKTVFVRQWRVNRPEEPALLREHPEKCMKEVARYAIQGDRVAKWQTEIKENWFMNCVRVPVKEWTRMGRECEVYDGGYWFYLPERWKSAVLGTSLEYIDLGGYMKHTPREVGRNPVRFMMDWARYRAVELLWKAGYTHMVDEKVTGALRQSTRNAVKWSAGTVQDALGVPLYILKRHRPEEWDAYELGRYRKCVGWWQEGRIREDEIDELFASDIELELIQDAVGHARVKKILEYKGDKYTYRDYLRECVQLGLDLGDKAVLFPKDLDAAHARTMKLVKFQQSKKDKENFKRRAEKLEKYSFSSGGLLIRPARKATELKKEGAALSHCVGGYAEDMAKGVTAIFFVRKEDEPDKPYYTLELRNRTVIQCRGKCNRSYELEPTVKGFVTKWLAEVVNANKKKKKKGAAA